MPLATVWEDARSLDEFLNYKSSHSNQSLAIVSRRITSREIVHDCLRGLEHASTEFLIALYDDVALNLISAVCVAQGGVSDVHVDLRQIFSLGLQREAAGFILVHNHPSGDPSPSQSDIAMTKKLRRVGNDLDLPLLDHFIIASGGVRRIEVDCC